MKDANVRFSTPIKARHNEIYPWTRSGIIRERHRYGGRKKTTLLTQRHNLHCTSGIQQSTIAYNIMLFLLLAALSALNAVVSFALSSGSRSLANASTFA